MVPFSAYSNKLPLVLKDSGLPWRRFCCLLGNFNSIPFDYVTRQKVGGANLNFFILEQIPVLSPDAYDDKCPWDKKRTLETWISERVLKLTCTANDMIPLAEAAGFIEKVHKWKEPERAELRAELDAAYFHLYGLSRDEAEYVLSTFNAMVDDSGPTLVGTATATGILEAYDMIATAMG